MLTCLIYLARVVLRLSWAVSGSSEWLEEANQGAVRKRDEFLCLHAGDSAGVLSGKGL